MKDYELAAKYGIDYIKEYNNNIERMKPLSPDDLIKKIESIVVENLRKSDIYEAEEFKKFLKNIELYKVKMVQQMESTKIMDFYLNELKLFKI